MYFLIGLGIILLIVYGNMLLDHIKEKKARQQSEQAAAASASAEETERAASQAEAGGVSAEETERAASQAETAGASTAETERAASQAETAGVSAAETERAASQAEAAGVSAAETVRAAAPADSGWTLPLAEVIEAKLKQKQYIFGLPLTVCENDGRGCLTALDREDNIYVIETALRQEYEDMALQVLADMAAQRRRIQKRADERRVYAIVCTNGPSEALRAAAEKKPGIRIFRYDISFTNMI